MNGFLFFYAQFDPNLLICVTLKFCIKVNNLPLTCYGYSREIGSSQAIATLGVAAVGLGEGTEDSRIFGQVCYHRIPCLKSSTGSSPRG